MSPRTRKSPSPAIDLDFILAEADQDDTSPSTSTGRQRASTACLQCRRLKSKCRRTSDGPCERCSQLNIKCEVVKSRRGRVLGSRNKRTGLEKSVAQVQAALDRIRRSALSPGAKAEQVAQKEEELEEAVRERRPSKRPRHDTPEAEVDPYLSSSPAPPSPFDDADLVVDSVRASPDPAEHPLRVLSDIGSSLPAANVGVSLPAASVGWGVPGWSRQQLAKASAARRLYFRHRPGAAKRDIAPVLDPVSRGIVTEQHAEQLVESFFQLHSSQLGIMDQKIHTLANLRARSALLTTAVLAAATLSTETELARKLYAHADGVLMTVLARNAKSLEIVVAFIILLLWPRCPKRIVDDPSRMFLALAINMSLELGLNRLSTLTDGDEEAQRWHRDKTRTWCALVIQDRSLAATSGKPPMIHEFPDISVMRRWMESPLATYGDKMMVGYLELRKIEKEARELLKATPRAYMIDGVRAGVSGILEGWMREWSTHEIDVAVPFNMMKVVSHHIRLLITTASNAPPSVVVDTARANLNFALEHLGSNLKHTIRTVCGMISWAAVLLLRLDRENSIPLVKSIALGMAPDGDGPDSYAQFYGAFLLGLCLEGPAPPPTSSGLGISPASLPAELSMALGSDFGSGSNQISPPTASLPSETGGLGELLKGTGSSPFDLSGFNLFQDLPFESQWDAPPQNQVAPSLDWLLNDSTAAGESALWGFGSDWAGNAGWNVDLTGFPTSS